MGCFACLLALHLLCACCSTYSTLLAAHAAAMHLPRETLIPIPLPVTTTYILHLHYPGRLSTGAGSR